MKKNNNTDAVPDTGLHHLTCEDFQAIARGEVLDEKLLQEEYDQRLNQAYSLWCLGLLGTMIWFYLDFENKLDLGFWDVAQTFTPLVGGLIWGLCRIYGPGKRLANAPLIEVIDPGIL